MKSKLVFRILGALSSALIIASVFVPFVKVTGYSQSLWQTNVNTLYLPIIIIVFGAIGVLLFAINLKTELVYSTTGALLFFLITQTIPIIKQGTFSTLNVGYYFLVAGTLFTGIMTFLCGLKQKQKVVEEPKIEVEEKKEDSIIDQIDRLYENQTLGNNENETIQPLQTIESVQPFAENNSLNMPIEENKIQLENSNNLLQPISQTNIQDLPKEVNGGKEESMQATNPVAPEFEIPKQEELIQETNPVASEFEVSKQEESMQATNPVVSEFEVSKQEESMQATNPVVSEFAISEVNESNNVQIEPQQTVSDAVVTEIEQSSVQTPNPVVSEFEVPSQFSFVPQPTVEEKVENGQETSTTVENAQPLQPLGSNMDKVDFMADSSTNKDNNLPNLDIFG